MSAPQPPTPPTAKAPLTILIVGCGLGGLSAACALTDAGHKVTMIESAAAIGDVGAGIQVSPNVTRLLVRWGIGDALAKIAVKPARFVTRRYSNGKIIGVTPLNGEGVTTPELPYYNVHRADLHRLLYERVAPHVTLRLNSKVVSVDPEAPSLTLESGEVLRGDLVIGADGVHSTLQQAVVGKKIPATPTGDAAYRALIPTELLLKDPDLKSFVENPEVTSWMGPRRHIVAYNVRSCELYNIVMAHPDKGSVESWTAEGSAELMRAGYTDFEPRVQKLLGLVESTLEWRLLDRQPLKTWMHPAGKLTLLGDACHPMLPYRAQGAAMAIEDAAVLGTLLSHITSVAQLPNILKAYEGLRLPRATAMQNASRLNQHYVHMPDGPEQEKRDAGMWNVFSGEKEGDADADTEQPPAPEKAGEVVAGSAEISATDAAAKSAGEEGVREERKLDENEKQKVATHFGYDAVGDAERWWRAVGVKEIGEVQGATCAL
ncbi:uncharacterized protein C8Q71DRAFT_561138 [Rhodofomes roseus]|uniref:FAD-binding domain-containing protein n=1 Tax=Rhodofomes roseus TaxID=34475 RepID=A0ABQ8KIJ7_9APHY|nr:uncharacterized protein C8Q71DRAFT_561138 [Rhodofomes roseus]KAH9837783.1 hypothetical protein C8Q71DRAFT_561138 [Rhodofomes roseus]